MRGPLLALALCLAALCAPAQAAAFGFLPGAAGFSAAPTGEGGAPATGAGSHPVALRFELNLAPGPAGPFAEGDLRELRLELPPGLIENPNALPACSQADFQTPRSSPWEESLAGESCPDRTQVGVLTLRSSYGGGSTRSFGLFNLAPPPGAPSELGANPYGAPIIFVPTLRQAEGEYGITLVTRNVSQLLGIEGIGLEIWGTPWSILHNTRRGNCLNEAEPDFGWAKCSVGPANTENIRRAYLTLPTSCGTPLPYTAGATSWQGEEALAAAQSPALGDCGSLLFEPQASAALSNPRASAPSGYDFAIEVDTLGLIDPARLAPSPLRRAVVRLPEGVTINPSVGAGLGVCTEAGYAAETASSPPGAGCPNESKIGDFTVRSPVVAGTLEAGSIFLAAPHRNPFDALIAIYLVAKSPERGILVKVAGELEADPSSGALTASFDRLPQLPYSELRLHFREGQRSPLATPAACGHFSTEADFSAWRDSSLRRHASLPLAIGAGPDGGPCPQGLAPFAPGRWAAR